MTPQILGTFCAFAVTAGYKPRSPQRTRICAFPCAPARRGRFRAKVRGAPARRPALPLPGGLSPPAPLPGAPLSPGGAAELSSPGRGWAGGAPGGRAGAGSGARRGPGPFGSVRQRLPVARRGRYLRSEFGAHRLKVCSASCLFFFFFFRFPGKRVFLQPGRGRRGGRRLPGAGARPDGPSHSPWLGGGSGQGRPAGCAAPAERSQPGGERRTSP